MWLSISDAAVKALHDFCDKFATTDGLFSPRVQVALNSLRAAKKHIGEVRQRAVLQYSGDNGVTIPDNAVVLSDDTDPHNYTVMAWCDVEYKPAEPEIVSPEAAESLVDRDAISLLSACRDILKRPTVDSTFAVSMVAHLVNTVDASRPSVSYAEALRDRLDIGSRSNLADLLDTWIAALRSAESK